MALRHFGCFVILCISIQAAQAQTPDPSFWTTPQNQPATAPGINVWQTLYPRAPQNNPAGSVISDQSARNANFTQPGGYTAGNFTFFPSITAATFYDDNVFALSNHRQGDWAAVLRPELAMKSNGLSNAEIYGNVAIEQRWFDRFNSENQFNAAAALGGTFGLSENAQFVGKLAYTRGHEDRGTSDTILEEFDKPIGYNQYEASGALNSRFGRLWTSIGLGAAWIDYDNADLSGVAISQNYRNGVIARVPVRVGYVVAPLTSVFLEVAANRRDFEVNEFDSKGYRIVGGMMFEPGQGSRVKGEAYAGYMNQDYNGTGFERVSTWTAGGSLGFLVADRWTLGLEGQRDAKEASPSGGITPSDGMSVVESIVTARADYRVSANLIAGAGLSYIRDQYLGGDRNDESLSPLVSVKYLMNPRVTLGFDYRYVTFGSDGLAVPSYSRNVYLLSMNGRF